MVPIGTESSHAMRCQAGCCHCHCLLALSLRNVSFSEWFRAKHAVTALFHSFLSSPQFNNLQKNPFSFLAHHDSFYQIPCCGGNCHPLALLCLWVCLSQCWHHPSSWKELGIVDVAARFGRRHECTFVSVGLGPAAINGRQDSPENAAPYDHGFSGARPKHFFSKVSLFMLICCLGYTVVIQSLGLNSCI